MAKPIWLNVSPSKGSGNGIISNSSTAHTGRLLREGIVTVTGSGVTTPATYNVIQTPLAEFVAFDNGAEMAVTKDGGKVIITGKSNSESLLFAWVGSSDVDLPTNYTAAGKVTVNGNAIEGDPGAVSQYEYNIEITLPANNDVDEVTRTLKVTANGGQSAQIAIKQSAGDAYLYVSPTKITIPQDGYAVSVEVTSNTDWSVS